MCPRSPAPLRIFSRALLALCCGGLTLPSCAERPPDPQEILALAKTAAEGLEQVRYRFRYFAAGPDPATEPLLEGRLTLRPLGRADRYQARIEVMSKEPEGAAGEMVVVHDGSTISVLRRSESVVDYSPLWVAGASLLAPVQDGVMVTFFDPASMQGEIDAAAVWEGRSEVGGVSCDLVRVTYEDDPEDSLWCFGEEDRLPRSLSWIAEDGADRLELYELETNFALDPAVFVLAADEGERRFVNYGLALGAEAPDFELATPEGELIRLSELRGKVVVLDFWATWCVPCWQSMDALQALFDELAGEPVSVFGVNTLESGDPLGFAEERGFTYPILLKGDAVHAAYAKRAIPAFSVVGPEGRILGTGVGYFGEETDGFLRGLVERGLRRAPDRAR